MSNKSLALVTIVVADYDQALDYYTNALGFRKIADSQLDRFQANGVEFMETEPRKAAYGTVIVFRDICGNLWDLLEPAKIPLDET